MKKLLRRHKSVLTALGIYWPFLFWLTHIPVPQIARQSGMNDKTMHFLAYFVLTFLIWFAISPYEKVRWNRIKCWLVILAVVIYGVADELIQAKVGRSADIMDFLGDLFGVLFALGLLSFLGFWGLMLTISSVFIFVLSDMSRLMTLSQYNSWAIAFHFTAYTAFTLIWIQWLQRFSRFSPHRVDWLAVSALVPFGLLGIVVIAALIWERPLNGFHSAIAAVGIVTAILVSWGVFKATRKNSDI